MSVIKSQIHDGFATIRTRGLHRSRSRAEQLEKLKPIVVTTASIHHQVSAPVTPQPPSLLLYENNNDLYYNFKNPDPVTPPPMPPPLPDYEHRQFSTLSTSCNSFKQSMSSGISATTAGSVDDDLVKTPPPPPISPCYENGCHTPKTPSDSGASKAFDYFPYTRPESPAYGQIKLHDSDTIEMYKLPSNGPPAPPRVFTPTYYRKDKDALDYALTKMVAAPAPTFPALKSHSLHYRKSYSHPAKTIYEDGRVEPAARYYSSVSNYYSPSEISDQVLYKKTDLENVPSVVPPPKFSGYEKRFATLSYPKESQRLRPQQRFSTSHVDGGSSAPQSELEYFDPLDCKIGCQTTLRSKPRIPWYELAIKKDIRRQSCPPNHEVNIFYIYYFSFTTPNHIFFLKLLYSNRNFLLTMQFISFQ